jgi:uridine kinase
VPRYDFATHGRLQEEEQLSPAPVLVVEGLWIFRKPQLRQLFDFKIFIRSSRELCTTRRLKRDTAERGRTRAQVLEQLERYTLPMSDRFVAPQEKWADILLEAPVGENDIFNIVNRIKSNLNTQAVGI